MTEVNKNGRRYVMGGSNPYLEVVSMLMGAGYGRKSSLSPEQQARLNVKRQARRDDERRLFLIRKGLCPVCETKLVRGKKRKDMEYKRQWHCTPCNQDHFA